MSTAVENDVVTVRIRSLPVGVHRRLVEYQDELQRELQLIVLGEDDADIPRRTLDLLDSLTVRYSGVDAEQTAAIEAAAAAGEEHIDLDYVVPADVAGACIDLARMLDETDRYLDGSDAMLTLSSPPDLVVYRRWFLGEFVAQATGLDPLPWLDADTQHLAATPHLRGQG